MKAAIYRAYGPPERLMVEEIDAPILQDEHEDRVIIRVHAASVNPYDVLHRQGYLPVRPTAGLWKPKQTVLGIDAAGTVEAVGKSVSRMQVGDRVFGNCLGAHAEFVRARQQSIGRMPDNLDFLQAAAIPTAALTALQALRDVAHIQKGQKLLVYGASGGVGHFAVQLGRYFEAEVTAVCSKSNLEWVKDLDADVVIDYTREDFAKSGKKYDIILDAVARRTYFNSRAALAQDGVYITENPLKPAYHPIQLLISAIVKDKRARMHLSHPNENDIDLLAQLAEKGSIRPRIEKVFTLDEIAAAHRHLENGHTKGKVVVQIR
jgi:NADPH:quinone reductase-like Zn-dependent oxidoreductase